MDATGKACSFLGVAGFALDLGAILSGCGYPLMSAWQLVHCRLPWMLAWNLLPSTAMLLPEASCMLARHGR